MTRRGRPVAAPAAGVGLGLLLAAPMLLPFLELLTTGWSYKTASADTFGYEAMGWGAWAEALSAMLLGTDEPMVDHVRFYAYLGPVALGLAAAGLVAARRRPGLRFVIPLVPLTFLLALPPPFMGWVAALPGLGHLKLWYVYPAFVTAVGIAAGIGAEAILGRVERPALRAVVGGAFGLFFLTQGPIRAGDLHAPRFVPMWPESEATRWLAAQPGPFRVMGLGGQVNAPNASVITGVEDLGLTMPLFPERYDAFFLGVDPKSRQNSFGTLRLTGRIDVGYLGRMNVRYLVNGKLPFGLLHTQLQPEDPFGLLPPVRVRHPQWPLVYEDDLVQIFENRLSYRPRAYLSGAAVAVPDLEAAVGYMQAHPRGGADVVETQDSETIARLATTSSAGSAQVEYPGHDRAVVQVEAAAPTLVVLADAYAAGWTATMNGAPAEILPVNALSRGVWVPAGRHTIEMRYAAPGLWPGVAVSALTGLLLLMGLRRARRAR